MTALKQPALRHPVTRGLAALAVLLLLGLTAARVLAFRFYPYHYRLDISRRAAEYQFDPLFLAAVVRTESKFNPQAVSRSGARGLMQVMPETGRWAAGELGIEPFDAELLYHPPTNLWIGSWYLDSLRQDFRGDIVLALAAYNGGRRNVAEWLATAQWNGEHQNIDQIPFRETREFIQRVMTAYDRYVWLYDGRGRWLTRDWPFWPAPR
ncbi:MAG: lytic transglycosylase domain-containing protein [Symbiobacteriia bacterium]